MSAIVHNAVVKTINPIVRKSKPLYELDRGSVRVPFGMATALSDNGPIPEVLWAATANG
jgi:hypothetical protein